MPQLKSNTEWKQWGKDDPLWGVTSLPGKQKGGEAPWTDDEFYAHGDSDWQDFFAHWRHYGVEPESCLEIGCGAGRMTRQLAQVFDAVHAVDVSRDMIEYARAKLRAPNVDFSVVDGLHLPHRDRCVKAVFSTHVLQHLDGDHIGFSYFREFYRVLDLRGTMMIHMPVYQFPVNGATGALMNNLYSIYRWLGRMRADAKRHAGTKTMRRTPYPMEPLAQFLRDLGFRRIEFRIFPTTLSPDLHPFVLATK